MRVLHVITTLGSGGAEKLLSDLLPRMREKNIQVKCLVLSSHGDVFSQDLIKSGVDVEFLSDEINLKTYTMFKKLKNHINDDSFDLVHAHLFPVQYFVPFATKLPIIFTTHSSKTRRSKKIFVPLEKFINKKFKRHTFVSEDSKVSFESFIDVKDDLKHRVIYNGIDINKIEMSEAINIKEQLKLSNEDVLLTMVSSFKPAKDHMTVVDAIKEQPNLHIAFVGEGNTMQEIEDYTEKSGVSNRVHFLGFRSDVYEVIKGSDIIIQSSFHEGFGISVAEAMACKKPVIVSDINGLKEVVDNPAYRFPVENDKVLLEKIDNLLLEEEYSKAVQYCYNQSKKFDIQNTVDQYIELYKELV